MAPDIMKVAVVGSGRIGTILAQALGDAGHQVWLSNSRGPQTLALTMTHMADSVTAATVKDAVEHADVVFLAIPFGGFSRLPYRSFGDRVIVDVSNYYPGRDGAFPYIDDGSQTSSEVIAAYIGPGPRVVKTLNHIHWRSLQVEPAPPGPGRRALAVAGDDDASKRLVIGLLDSIGFDGVDAGPLSASGVMGPGGPLYGPRFDSAAMAAALAAGPGRGEGR